MVTESASSPASTIATAVARFAEPRVWSVDPSTMAEVPPPDWLRAAAAGARCDGPVPVNPADRFHVMACLEQAARRGHSEAEVVVDDRDDPVLMQAIDLRPTHDVIVAIAGHQLDSETPTDSGTGIDAATGLLDRQGLDDRIQALPAGRGAGLFVVEIQGLVQAVGSTEEGDALVAEIADRLRQRLADHGWLARIALDRFALLMSEELGAVDGERLADTMAAVVRQPLALSVGDRQFTPAVGWVSRTGDDAAGALLYDAELAVREADRLGTGNAVEYTDRLRSRGTRRLRLRHDLSSALARDELFLDFQPMHDLHQLNPIGAEALMRWQHPSYGLVRPADFIPLAEESGVIADLGWWLADQAVRALVAMRSTFVETADFFVAINVSGRQLNDDRLVRDLERVIQLHEVEAESVMVELTETALLAGDQGVETLLRVADLGCRLAIDDFGAGFASLDYLSRLPVASVKLHQSFVHRIDEPRVATLISAVLDMCRHLGVGVLAEGIETSHQLRRLRDLGVAEGQGYMLGRPAALDSLIGESAAAGVTRPKAGPAVLVP